jgi:hypothetical protein
MRRTRLRLAASIAVFALATLPVLAATEGAAAAASPEARVYDAHVKAMAAGDYQAFRATMSKTALAMMDKQNKDMNLDPKKMMEMMKAMAPVDLKYTGMKVDGKKATLDVTAKISGEQNWGTVSLVQEDAGWKVETESWSNTKK